MPAPAAAGRLSDSLPESVLAFLRGAGLVRADEVPSAATLAGGVSSDIWKVETPDGMLCVKRALPRLRVAQLWEAPVERNLYERRWLDTAARIVPGIAPRVLAASDEGCFAMEYLGTLPLWKQELREGRADPEFARSVGSSLARIHSATANDAAIARQFPTDANFHAIRLEPYLLATARVHTDLATQLHALVERTASTRIALVHGDVSPKNILCGPDGPVVLDAECAWFGDPAFDPAFCLNHLLLKGLWVPAAKERFLACYTALAGAYLDGATWEPRDILERRIASLLPGLLLARVDGKSPAEYLTTDAQKDTVRHAGRMLLAKPPSTLEEIRIAWQKS